MPVLQIDDAGVCLQSLKGTDQLLPSLLREMGCVKHKGLLLAEVIPAAGSGNALELSGLKGQGWDFFLCQLRKAYYGDMS